MSRLRGIYDVVSGGLMTAADVAGGWNWRLIGKLFLIVGVLGLAYILIAKPRIELANSKTEIAVVKKDNAEADQKRQKAVADAIAVVNKAQNDVNQEAAKIRSKAEVKAKKQAKSDEVLIQKIEQNTAENGETLLSDRLDAFFKDLANEEI